MPPQPQVFTVFFDGDCPLCQREIRWIRKRNSRGTLEFVDISHAEFDAAKWGKGYRALMNQIHGLTSDGRWVIGIEVFRQIYSRIGFRWLVAASRLPLFNQGLSLAYRVFASQRLRLTRRCDAGGCKLPAGESNR